MCIQHLTLKTQEKGKAAFTWIHFTLSEPQWIEKAGVYNQHERQYKPEFTTENLR